MMRFSLPFFHPLSRLKPRKLSIILIVSLSSHPSKISPFYHHAAWQKCFGGDALSLSKDLQCVHSSFPNSSLNTGIRRQKQSLLTAIPITAFLKLLKEKLTYLGRSGAWAWHHKEQRGLGPEGGMCGTGNGELNESIRICGGCMEATGVWTHQQGLYLVFQALPKGRFSRDAADAVPV